MRTSELTGLALDWAVAKCEGVEYRYMKSVGGDYNGNWWYETRRYSTDWAQGGPIIERERINIHDHGGDGWTADDSIQSYKLGQTPLIAAMRCYVASKLGDEVDVPGELT